MSRPFLPALLATLLLLGSALAQVELRMTWYDDGNEGLGPARAARPLRGREPRHPVVMDTVPYASGIQQSLPLQLASGQGPDMARVTDLGNLQQYFLDMRPTSTTPATGRPTSARSSTGCARPAPTPSPAS
jgi:alpha-1,4-digalacturonate transport system substrate-binding protein